MNIFKQATVPNGLCGSEVVWTRIARSRNNWYRVLHFSGAFHPEDLRGPGRRLISAASGTVPWGSGRDGQQGLGRSAKALDSRTVRRRAPRGALASGPRVGSFSPPAPSVGGFTSQSSLENMIFFLSLPGSLNRDPRGLKWRSPYSLRAAPARARLGTLGDPHVTVPRPLVTAQSE